MTATLITCIISWAVSFFFRRPRLFLLSPSTKGMQKREKALQDGVQSLLRNQLIEYHDNTHVADTAPFTPRNRLGVVTRHTMSWVVTA